MSGGRTFPDRQDQRHLRSIRREHLPRRHRHRADHPYTIFEVSAGFHAIRLTLDGHTDWGPRGVSVTVRETTTVHATLERTNQPPGPVTPSEDLGLGLKRMDVEAYQSAHILRADPVALPASVDLSVDAPLPRSQSRQGSCVGWAVAFAVKTYHERIERGWPLTDNRHVMSPAYVYNQVRVPGGGAYFVDAFNVLIEQGVSSWALMPYDPSDNRSQPSSAARADDYKIADSGGNAPPIRSLNRSTDSAGGSDGRGADLLSNREV